MVAISTTLTHYLVVDSDDESVLAWFPVEAYPDALDALHEARALAESTGHRVQPGRYSPETGFEVLRVLDF